MLTEKDDGDGDEDHEHMVVAQEWYQPWRSQSLALMSSGPYVRCIRTAKRRFAIVEDCLVCRATSQTPAPCEGRRKDGGMQSK